MQHYIMLVSDIASKYLLEGGVDRLLSIVRGPPDAKRGPLRQQASAPLGVADEQHPRV